MERSAGRDDTAITRFSASKIPQLFAERSSVPAIDYVPSVRVSSDVTWRGWARFVSEQLYGTTRSSPALRQLATSISEAAKAAPDDRARLGAAIVAWVTTNIEAADDLRDPASYALARGRGNRLALVLALARELGVPAEAVLVRSRLTADGDAKRRRSRRIWTTSPTRWSGSTSAIHRARGRFTSTCACATRASAICRPAWTARAPWRSPTGALTWRPAPGPRISAPST